MWDVTRIRRDPRCWVAAASCLLSALLPLAAQAAISAAPAVVTVVAGEISSPVNLTISAANNLTQEARTLTVGGLPPGASVIPTPLVASFSSSTSGLATLALATAPTTPPGTYPLSVGLGNFGIGMTTVTLVVPGPTVTATPSTLRLAPGATSGAVTVSVANLSNRSLHFQPSLPPALTGRAAVNPSPVTVTIPAGATSGTAPFTVTLDGMAPAGSFPIAFADATTGLAFTVTVQVVPPPARLSASPGLVTVAPGDAAAVAVSLGGAPAGTYPLTLELPASLAGSVVGEPAAPMITVGSGATGSLTLRLRTAAATPPGDHRVRLRVDELAVAAEFTLRVGRSTGSLRVSPASLRLVPGQTSGPLTLELTGSNESGRRLSFSGQSPAGLRLLPDPVVLTVASGGAAARASFQIEATAGAVPGSYRLHLDDASLGLGAEVTVVVEAPRGFASLSPARLRLAPGTSSEPVSLVVADSNLGGRTLSFVASSTPPGLTAAPSPLALSVPPGGAPATGSFRVHTAPTVPPGVYKLRLAAALPGGASLAAELEVEVARPVELLRLTPAQVTPGATEVPLRLAGSGFQPGARLEASSVVLRFGELRVLSPEIAETRLSVRRDAPVGSYSLTLVNPDGSRSRQPLLLAVVDRGSLAAPVSVQTVAMVHPAAGALLARDERLLPRGVLATSGTGTVIGSWRFDGVPFDRFVVLARGGEPVTVAARTPLPPSFLGRHRLELVVESPQEIASAPVEIVLVQQRANALRLYAPAEGEVVGRADLVFRWSPLPGAAGYQVEIETDGSRQPLVARSAGTEWSPGRSESRALGSGLYTWRVRPVLAGGALGEATEARPFALLPDGVELRPQAARRGDDGTGWLLTWDGGTPGLLYRVELADDGGDLVLSALLAAAPYRTPDDAPVFAHWRVVALGPGGTVVATSSWQGVGARAGAGRDGGGGGGGSGRHGGGRSFVYRFAAAETPAAVDLDATSPTAGSEVATPFPRLQAAWEPAVDPARVSLLLDGVDITALAELTPTSVDYESLLPLEPGEHRVELRVGETGAGWSFSVAATAAAAGDGGPGNGGGSWQLGAEGTLSLLSADELSDDQTTASLALSAQVDQQRGDLFAQGSGDVARSELISGGDPSRDVETRNWLLNAGRRGAGSRQEVAVGYASPDFLFDSQLLGGGLPQGGGQLTLGAGGSGGSGGASASYFRTFDPDFAGTAGGGLAPAVDVDAGALTWGDAGGRFEVRAVGLRADEKSADFSPGGEGDVVGLLATYRGAGGLSLTFEGARGDYRPDPESFEEARGGHAFRLAAAGSRGAYGWGLTLHYTEDGFVNPAQRGLTPAAIADRAGAELTLSRGFASGALLSLELKHLRGGTDSGLDARDAQQDGGRLQWTGPLGDHLYLTFGGHLVSTRGGGDPALGLPAADRLDRGLQLSLQESVGTTSFGQSFHWQDAEDGADPNADSELLGATLSASTTLSPAFSFFAQVDGLRQTRGGVFGGTTETLLAALQGTWNLAASGLSLQPYVAYNRSESEFAFLPSAGASETESYRLTVSWTPPRIGRYLSLQTAAEWTRGQAPGLPGPTTTARYTAAVTLRWAPDSTAAGGAATTR